MNRIQTVIVAVLMLLVGVTWSQEQQSDILLQALTDEMQRTMSQLKDDEQDSSEIYFVSYRVLDSRYVSSNYELGAHVSTRRDGERVLQVDLRIGSYESDQSNFSGGRGVGNFLFQSILPRTDDYDEIRRVAWRITDAAFKNRINVYAQKQTALANQTSSEERDPDFTRETPVQYRSTRVIDDASWDALAETGKELSALFLDATDLYSSRVTTNAVNRRVLFINSEGTVTDVKEQRCEIFTTASTQNESGRELRDFRAHYAIDCSTLPTIENMQRDVQDMITSLQTMRAAEELEDVYFGPIMFEGQAAAQFFKTYLVSNLVASRPPLTANPRQSRQQRNTFLDRIGARVVSTKVNVVNDPLLTDYKGRPLIGSYSVDREGVLAQRTVLIEDGKLQTLLTTRTPVDDLRKSNGSRRGSGFLGSVGIPGNILITPQEGLSTEEMQAEFWQWVSDYNSEYGIVIRHISSPNAMEGNMRGLATVMEAYKVFPDGREILLAPVELLDISERTIRRDIAAVSAELTQFDTTQYNRSGVTIIPVSIVAPSLIIEELGVRSVEGSGSLPPVVPHPYSEAPTIQD